LEKSFSSLYMLNKGDRQLTDFENKKLLNSARQGLLGTSWRALANNKEVFCILGLYSCFWIHSFCMFMTLSEKSHKSSYIFTYFHISYVADKIFFCNEVSGEHILLINLLTFFFLQFRALFCTSVFSLECCQNCQHCILMMNSKIFCTPSG